MDLTSYGIDKAVAESALVGIPGRPYQPNLTERLEMQIKELEERLARLREAHSELKKNPGIEHLLNLLQRV
jgi:hypothetical protein